MQPQTKVRRKSDGKVGVVVMDPYLLCELGETPVVFDGETDFVGVEPGQLEELGPENAVADPDRCGSGKGAECCIFLTFTPNGFECQRFSALHETLKARKSTMTAQREPTAMFPNCQLPSPSQ